MDINSLYHLATTLKWMKKIIQLAQTLFFLFQPPDNLRLSTPSKRVTESAEAETILTRIKAVT